MAELKTERITIERADEYRGLYFPIASETGLRSALTPDLAGDAKMDQNHFLFEPTSIEDLTEKTFSRNFWLEVEPSEGDTRIFSLTGRSASQIAEAVAHPEKASHTTLTAGYMWQRIERKEQGIESSITSFIPYNSNTEIHMVALTNAGPWPCDITLTTAFPIYGRSADNLRDHRHVTSLLNRTEIHENGIFLTPTMSFDERGHKENEVTYFVAGFEGDGGKPLMFYPDLNQFSGETGNLLSPEAIYRQLPGITYEDSIHFKDSFQGREALGGIRFKKKKLLPGETATYLVLSGIGTNKEDAEGLASFVTTYQNAAAKLEETRSYWKSKVKISVETGDSNFDLFMRWVAFQPELRRVYGCSFLPHHDYGRGGRGWRDLWQDCLALLLMDPRSVRDQLIASAGGFRIDGTNATIIGEKLGEFKADRNGIQRIWMDHGFWPYLTSELYYDLTGDHNLWITEEPYFSDNTEDGQVKTENQETYLGTHIEHLLLATLREFYDAGEHGMMRLRGADWNDAIDLGAERGESVAFTHAYGMNLRSMSRRLLEFVGEKMKVSKLLYSLLEIEAVSIEERQNAFILFEINAKNPSYLDRIEVETTWVMDCLDQKATILEDLLRRQEWMTLEDGTHLFRSYYDNDGASVDYAMLTGQVFSIMSGIATDEMVDEIVQTVNTHLTDSTVGGVRLNENLGKIRMNLGRMTGFAYGTKENGAVFSHMSVMYANALLHRGRVEDGFSVLSMLYRQAMDQKRSRMLPGIPEYFDPMGRGVYTYLTGAASWFLYTVVCEIFGIHYTSGEVEFRPKIPNELFGERDAVMIQLPVYGKQRKFTVRRDQSIVTDEEI